MSEVRKDPRDPELTPREFEQLCDELADLDRKASLSDRRRKQIEEQLILPLNANHSTDRRATMVEIKTHSAHPSSMEERIAKRLRPSNDTAHADVVKKQGDSPLRTITTVHHSRNTQYGQGAPEEPGIDGRKRDKV